MLILKWHLLAFTRHGKANIPMKGFSVQLVEEEGKVGRFWHWIGWWRWRWMYCGEKHWILSSSQAVYRFHSQNMAESFLYKGTWAGHPFHNTLFRWKVVKGDIRKNFLLLSQLFLLIWYCAQDRIQQNDLQYRSKHSGSPPPYLHNKKVYIKIFFFHLKLFFMIKLAWQYLKFLNYLGLKWTKDDAVP